ncbi:uncharacterized protein [Phaseolus vulgaris]|uniref:uncharacterized protein isoform X2 n=1 Tax=Phaseolus vulgaris TaxID=3885 RepID=UPI0035C95893
MDFTYLAPLLLGTCHRLSMNIFASLTSMLRSKMELPRPMLMIFLLLCWFMAFLDLAKGDWGLCRTLLGRRRKMKGFLSLIWALSPVSMIGGLLRARELFYYLKGGQVDYGEEHSTACGHSQFGRIYEQGHYPEWDEDHPIHFVGHSAGAQVVRVLQQMLADKEFKGYENSSENWVLSITSLSGAFNGTTRTYTDGMQPEDGKTLKPICLLQLCRIGVIIYDWFDISWLKNYYNFGFDHFNMSWRKMGIWGLVDCLLGNAGPFASGDWILPDLTIQGSIRLNYHLQTFPNTYYFSYATKRTTKIMGVTVPSSILGIHPMLFIRVLQMSQWCYPSDVPPPYKGYRDEDWQDNDGALNTISMTHPLLPIEHPNCLVEKESDCKPLQPGIWYYKYVEGDHILFIINRERAGVQFDLIYDSIFQRCRKHVFRKKPPTMPNEIHH